MGKKKVSDRPWFSHVLLGDLHPPYAWNTELAPAIEFSQTFAVLCPSSFSCVYICRKSYRQKDGGQNDSRRGEHEHPSSPTPNLMRLEKLKWKERIS